MNSKYISSILIITLMAVIATPASAKSLQTTGEEALAGVTAAVAAFVVVVVLVAIHYSKPRSITGCVVSSGNGLTISDEKDKQIYALSGDVTGVKPGDRIKLKGKKEKQTGPDKTLVWKATDVAKDLGVCHP